MKKSDNYADTLFVVGLSALYNVSVRIASNSYDEPHSFTEPKDVITVCFLPSAEHYNASRQTAPTIIYGQSLQLNNNVYYFNG